MRTTVIVLSCVVGMMWPRPSLAEEASETGNAVRAAANRLALGQVQSGPFEGSWPGEEAYTGSIVAGLVHAYGITTNEDAKIAAIAGGNFILRAAAGNYYGDEAYALMCLSTMSDDAPLSMWRFVLDDFYHNVSHRSQGGTAGYIAQFAEVDPSIAVYFLAHHTVAAFYVDTEDKSMWREALVDYLIRVDDDAESPVMALGMATWALVTIGPLEDSPLDPNGEGVPYWSMTTASELPQLLLTHQVREGQDAGSFYWRFDHGNAGLGGPFGGYTEELVSSTLALAAVHERVDDPEIEPAIEQARDLLVGSIDEDGGVRQHLTLGGEAYFYETAGVLRALADSDPNGRTDDDNHENGPEMVEMAHVGLQ